MIKDLPEGETQYDHFDELIAQLRVARDNFYRSKAMSETALREEVRYLHQVCRNVYEVWAGSEGIPVPQTCPEAYLLQLIEQMRDAAKEGFKTPNV
jgi:hypothetical protein